MPTIMTGNHPKALWPGVKAWWGIKYKEHPAEYIDLFDQDTSDKAYEEDVQDNSFGLAPIKPEGQAIAYDTASQGYTTRYRHITYALGAVVSREAIRDGQYESRARIATENLAFSMRQTKENVAAAVYNRATTAAYTGGDGVTLLNTAHPRVGGTFSNRLAVAAPLSESSLEDVITMIMKATNSMGLRISLIPKSLIVPPDLHFTAGRILKSTQTPDTSNNAVNVVRSSLSGGEVLNHYLTSATAWFVRTNAPRGMIFYQREGVSFDRENDFDTTDAKMRALEAYSCGWTNPLGLFGTEGA